MHDTTTLPPISVPQLDGLRDLFRLGIVEAILAQAPGDRQFTDALANLVTYELISTLVVHLGPELKAFGAGADRQFESDAGYNRVIGFMSLLDLAFNTDTHPTVDALDTHAEEFLGECYDAVSVVVAGVIDALVATAPGALVDGLSIGQPAESRAAVATAVAGWGIPDTLFTLEELLDYQRVGKHDIERHKEPPAGAPGEPR